MARRWLPWLKRRWLLVLVVVGSLILGALRFNEIAQVAVTLLRGQLQWVLVAATMQVFYYALYAVLYKFGFLTVEVHSRWRELVPVLFASIFLKAIVPSGGVSAAALFVDDAARRGQSSVRAAEGALLVLGADLVTMVPLLLFGLHYLSLRNALQSYQVLGVAAFLAFTAGLAAMMLLGQWQPGLLYTLLHGIQEAANRAAALLRRPPLLAEDWARHSVGEFTGAAAGITNHPHHLGRTLAVALLVHVMDVIGLYAIFLAYGQKVGLGPVMVGFGLDVVFSVVSFIPHGIGVAEGVLTLAFTSLGIPSAKALVVALAFRGLNVWLPLAIGFLFLHKVRSFGAGKGSRQRSGSS